MRYSNKWYRKAHKEINDSFFRTENEKGTVYEACSHALRNKKKPKQVVDHPISARPHVPG